MASASVSHLLRLQAFFLLLSGYVLPQGQEVSAGSPFDAGSVVGCEVPQTSYCTGITYEVPSSIAWLTEVIEFEIRNTVDPEGLGDRGMCTAIFKETLCRKKFPRCSSEQNQVFFETSDNCEERLRSNCQPRLANSLVEVGRCNATQTSLRSGSCRTLSSYNQDGDLQHCNLLGRDMHVSDWMYEYVKQVDLELQQSFHKILGHQLECWQQYRNFLCGAVGDCVGDRVWLINTMDTCQSVIDW